MEFNLQEVRKAYLLNVQRFTYDRSEYLTKNGYRVDDGTRRQIWEDYEITIREGISGLRKLFPDGFIHEEGTIKFSLDEMSEDVKSFLNEPTIDCTIKPLGDDSSALLSFKDGRVVEAHDMNKIPGLPAKYQKDNFNRLFKGSDVQSVRLFLDVYKVLPDNNLLDMILEEHKMRVFERNQFIKVIIEKLLLNNNEDDLARAYLFDHFMGGNFDFEQFKGKTEKRTK